MQNIKEISDTLRGPKVNARRHWDGENWILEDAKTRKPLLIGTRAQILDEYDRINKTPWYSHARSCERAWEYHSSRSSPRSQSFSTALCGFLCHFSRN